MLTNTYICINELRCPALGLEIPLANQWESFYRINRSPTGGVGGGSRSTLSGDEKLASKG